MCTGWQHHFDHCGISLGPNERTSVISTCSTMICLTILCFFSNETHLPFTNIILQFLSQRFTNVITTVNPLVYS